MKINFENKLLVGFVVNVILVTALGFLYVFGLQQENFHFYESWMGIIGLILIVVSVILLFVVYGIMSSQQKLKRQAGRALEDNEAMLQSILDNTSNPIFIKKLNGEYLLINNKYEDLFHVSKDEIIGKTDHDFLSKELADSFRNSDLEVAKANTELKTEEKIQQKDGVHTYIAVKFPLYDAKGRIYAIGGISTDITDRKRFEESIKESDKFFRLSLNILVVASGDKFVKFSPSLVKTLGYGEKELYEKSFFEFIHPDDHEATMEEIKKLQQGENVINFENRWICKDESIKWLSWTASPDPSSGLLYAVAQDITEKVKNREKVQMANQFFNMSYDLLVVAKGDYFVRVNPAYTRILGYELKEMGKQNFISFAHPDDQEACLEAINKLKSGESESIVHFRMRARCKDGSYKWLEWTCTIDPNTGFMYAVAQDINEQVNLEMERKEAVQELFENEQKLKLILENINEGVIVTTPDQRVIMANSRANEIIGIENDDDVAASFTKHFEMFFPDEKTVFPSQNLPLEKALKGEATDDVDIVIWDAGDQQKKRVLISGRPIVDEQNNVLAAVMTIKDISRYKQLENELKEAELKYRTLIGFKKE